MLPSNTGSNAWDVPRFTELIKAIGRLAKHSLIPIRIQILASHACFGTPFAALPEVFQAESKKRTSHAMVGRILWSGQKMLSWTNNMDRCEENFTITTKNFTIMATKPGLYANIHAKQERIKAGSGEKMRKPGTKGAPTSTAFKQSAKTAKVKK